MSFVLDNSVAICWLYPAPNPADQAYADGVLRLLAEGSCVTPALFWFESAHVPSRLAAQKHVSLEQASSFMRLIRRLGIQDSSTQSRELAEQAFMIAVEHKLTAYDAGYLACCIVEGLPLATLDGLLGRVARKMNVPLFAP